jgi:uncharacterized protein (DUF302 family)
MIHKPFTWLSGVVLLMSALAQPALAEEPTAREEGPVIEYKAGGDFDLVIENLKTAIGNQGLLVSSELHMSEMLDRTGKDLGFPQPVYGKSAGIGFCSALLAHKMAQAHPLNMTICPLAISVYSKAAEPQQVYLAFRKPVLLGDDKGEVTKQVLDLFHQVAKEAAGGW